METAVRIRQPCERATCHRAARTCPVHFRWLAGAAVRVRSRSRLLAALQPATRALPCTRAPLYPRSRGRSIRNNDLIGTIPTELGNLTALGALCAALRPVSALAAPRLPRCAGSVQSMCFGTLPCPTGSRASAARALFASVPRARPMRTRGRPAPPSASACRERPLASARLFASVCALRSATDARSPLFLARAARPRDRNLARLQEAVAGGLTGTIPSELRGLTALTQLCAARRLVSTVAPCVVYQAAERAPKTARSLPARRARARCTHTAGPRRIPRAVKPPAAALRSAPHARPFDPPACALGIS